MLNKLKELREANEEGFTLIELLVVIVIIGILAAIALPIFLNQQKAAIAAGVKSDVKGIQTAVATFLVKKPTATNADFVAEIAGATTGTTLATSQDLKNALANKSDSGTTLSVVAASGAATTLAWDNWKVTGANANAGGTTTVPFRYEYSSPTGKYQTFSNGGTTAD